MIGIIDYGMGNLASVQNALEQLGCASCILQTPSAWKECDRLILPGVGSFAQAMANLTQRGWHRAIHDAVAANRPLLGICLGMQLLFERGYEHGDTAGLGLIEGEVVLMQPEAGHRLPHVGWNSLIHARTHPLLAGVKDHVDVYFVHSYHCVPRRAEDVLARCDHGGQFVASVAHNGVAGMQFHPEKSQPMGLRILDNFSTWNPAC